MSQPTELFDLTVQSLWAEPPLDTATQPLQSTFEESSDM